MQQVGLPPGYGRRGGRPPRRHSKTALDDFSARGPLLQAPFAVGFVVAVTERVASIRRNRPRCRAANRWLFGWVAGLV